MRGWSVTGVQTCALPMYETVGGLANAWENNTTPGPGDWGNLFFRGTSPGSVLDHVVVRYGGSEDNADIFVPNSSPTITHSEISNSVGYGILANGGVGPALIGNNIHDNASWGAVLSGSIGPITGNLFDHDAGGVLFNT